MAHARPATEADLQEYRRRLDAVRALMRAEGFDAIVATEVGGEAHIPGGHVKYLTNFVIKGLHQSVVIPMQGEPTLVVQPGSRDCVPEWARSEAWVTEVRSTPTDKWPPRQFLAPDIVAALTDYGYGAGRIGLCGGFPQSEDVQNGLPKAEVTAATSVDGRGVGRDLVERVRAIKSPWEIERLRLAQERVELGITAFFAAVEPGRKLVRAVAAGEWAAKRQDAEELFVYMASSGTGPWVWWKDQDTRYFDAQDIVAAEANARYEGYIAQIARTGVIGRPTAAQERLIHASRDALQAMSEEARPGMTGGELYDIGARVVRAAGVAPNSRFGHGMGLSMAEGNDVMRDDDNPIHPQACLELHPGVFDPDLQQSAMIGDQFIFENERLVPLSAAERVVPYDLAPGHGSEVGALGVAADA